MREIRVVDRKTEEIVETLDLSGETSSGAQQVLSGLKQQMNHTDYKIEVS